MIFHDYIFEQILVINNYYIVDSLLYLFSTNLFSFSNPCIAHLHSLSATFFEIEFYRKIAKILNRKTLSAKCILNQNYKTHSITFIPFTRSHRPLSIWPTQLYLNGMVFFWQPLIVVRASQKHSVMFCRFFFLIFSLHISFVYCLDSKREKVKFQ